MWFVWDFLDDLIADCKGNDDSCQLEDKENDKDKKIKAKSRLWIKYRTIDFLAPQIIKTSKNSKNPRPMKKISRMVKD